MTFNWSGLLTLQNFVRLLDILAVWFVIYELIVLLRGTKAVQLFRGIVVIAIIKAVSVLIGLDTVSWIMDQIINWAVIAMVIIFQPEIRRGLEHLGRGSMFARGKRQNEDEERMIAELDKS